MRAQRRRLRPDRLILPLPGRGDPGVDRRARHDAALLPGRPAARGPAAEVPRWRRPPRGPRPPGGRRRTRSRPSPRSSPYSPGCRLGPPGRALAAGTETTGHEPTVPPAISTAPAPPRPLHPPVTQRDLEAEVAHCVGGVVSPTLLNVALHGLEEAAGVRYFPDGMRHAGKSEPGTPVVIRYADDLVALCVSEEQARQVKQQLAVWLAPKGLAFNEDKTRVVRLEEGFDFLGFNVRRYRNGKLLTKPSKAAVRRIRSRLAAEVEALHGANAEAVINKLNPVIRGWAAYYRTGVSKEIFSSLDHYMWRLTYRWGLRAHPNKSKRWVVARYFGAFHPTRRDRWVFGDRDTGRFLVKFSWTKIVRHRLVKGRASPDDPALTGYWADRRRRRKPPLGRFVLRLLHAQHGRCPGCGTLLLHADQEPQSPTEWEQWLTAVRKAIRRTALATEDGSPPDDTARCLMHAHCARRRIAARAPGPATLPARGPAGLA
ncbi:MULTISPECIES: group II intron maturase-specific domain-containing protein [unclassified Streptomyces]|uniref:group II intron maturase-specific domain-containing protein n=1 Tax=unclassified Streptomyces TaxID=2593676 RepID=UPI003D8CD9FE